MTLAHERPTLLMLRALGLGDFLTSVPAMRALRRAYPHHALVLAAPRALHPLAIGAGLVDACLPVPSLDVAIRAPRTRVDVGVNLHGRGPESHRNLVSLDPHRLLGFGRPDRPTSGPQWRDDEHDRTRWCRMLAWYGVDADPDDFALDVDELPRRADADLDARNPDGFTIVHPGASAASRRWPHERWATVIRRLRQEGHEVVVTGGPGERTLADVVTSGGGLHPEANRAGTSSLLALAALVGRARLVLCGDTGVAHLATAFGTPSVVLFGPVSPASWGPPSENPRHRALWHGGVGDPHSSTTDAGLLEITPSEVLAAIAQVDPCRVAV